MNPSQPLSVVNPSVISLRLVLYTIAVSIAFLLALGITAETTARLHDLKPSNGLIILVYVLFLIHLLSHVTGTLYVTRCCLRGQYNPTTTIIRSRVQSVFVAMALTALFMFRKSIIALAHGELFYRGYEHEIWLSAIVAMWFAAITCEIIESIFFAGPTRKFLASFLAHDLID